MWLVVTSNCTLLYIKQGSTIRSVRILFSERYVRTLTYSILAYVNKNRIRKQTMIAETANWFFATVLINVPTVRLCIVQKLIKFRDAILFHRVMDPHSCTGVNG